jgi:hypothetical protein
MKLCLLAVFVTLSFPLFAGECFLGHLIKGISKKDAIINDKTIFTVSAGEVFLYDNNTHSAYIKNGQSAYLPPEMVEKETTQAYFHFEFPDSSFKLKKGNEARQGARKLGVDYQELLKRALAGDSKALKELFLLTSKMDSAGAGLHQNYLWMVVNRWKDEDLKQLFESGDKKFRKLFVEILLDTSVTWPIEKPPEDYFSHSLVL